MIKSRKLLLTVVLGLMIVFLLEPRAVTAQATRSDFTATEYPTGLTYPGDWKLLPNGGQHFRGQVIPTKEVASDPRVSGTGTLVANGNLDPTGTGPIWGTITMAVPDGPSCEGGGVWKARWTGKMSFSEGYVYWSGVMHGISGCVEGLKVKFESDKCVPQASSCSYSGTLLDPHGE